MWNKRMYKYFFVKICLRISACHERNISKIQNWRIDNEYTTKKGLLGEEWRGLCGPDTCSIERRKGKLWRRWWWWWIFLGHFWTENNLITEMFLRSIFEQWKDFWECLRAWFSTCLVWLFRWPPSYFSYLALRAKI